MSSGGSTTSATWPVPGPGTWTIDTAHYGPTVSRIARDVNSAAMREGMRDGFALMGAPLATIDNAWVNGRFYLRLVPLVGGDRDMPDPPAALLWVLTRLHPAFRKRAKRAREAIDGRVWRDEYQRWTEHWKPDLLAANRRFGAVDVTTLSDEQLADHLAQVKRHLDWSAALHFRIHASDLGPIGRLLVAGEGWGLDPKAIMAALAGASPSTSAPKAALDELRAEVASHGVRPDSLDDVRTASARAADLLDRYLAEFGGRLTTGYDLRDRTLAELPDVVLASIVDARDDPASADVVADAGRRGGTALGRLRAEVEPDARDEFDELFDDARMMYGLRDENGPLTWEWPAGNLRRAVVEAGCRLAMSGRLGDVEHVFDADADEVIAMLCGADEPTVDELRDRCTERMSWATLDPPSYLGRPPADDPPIHVLPDPMPLMMQSVSLVMQLLERNAEHGFLVGTGVGDGAYRGTARVVDSADEAMERAAPGDVIVTRLTVPTFNSVLAMAGGVVTEHGGLLCHTAVIARELGIPAVVGVSGALGIPDGAEVELDPVAGTVTVVT